MSDLLAWLRFYGRSSWLALPDSKHDFTQAENFPEQHNFSHAAISQAETLLAGISNRDKVPERTLKKRTDSLSQFWHLVATERVPSSLEPCWSSTNFSSRFTVE